MTQTLQQEIEAIVRDSQLAFYSGVNKEWTDDLAQAITSYLTEQGYVKGYTKNDDVYYRVLKIAKQVKDYIAGHPNLYVMFDDIETALLNYKQGYVKRSELRDALEVIAKYARENDLDKVFIIAERALSEIIQSPFGVRVVEKW